MLRQIKKAVDGSEIKYFSAEEEILRQSLSNFEKTVEDTPKHDINNDEDFHNFSTGLPTVPSTNGLEFSPLNPKAKVVEKKILPKHTVELSYKNFKLKFKCEHVTQTDMSVTFSLPEHVDTFLPPVGESFNIVINGDELPKKVIFAGGIIELEGLPKLISFLVDPEELE